jgi:hypothetical protein
MAKRKPKPETSPATPPPVSAANSMAITHPAEPATAFWYLRSTLCNLLCWSEHPDPEPLDSEWLGKIASDLTQKTDSALRSVEQMQDKTLATDIKRARQLGVKFATLLHDNPSLSTVRIQDWTVPRFRKIFDELSELESKFERQAMRHAEFNDQAGRRIIRGMVERDDETGFVETNTHVPAHWMPVIRWVQKQFGTQNASFPEGELWKLFPDVDGFPSLMKYLESIGAIDPQRWGAFLIEFGDGMGVLPTVNDRRDINPLILSHPELQGVARVLTPNKLAVIRPRASSAEVPREAEQNGTPILWSSARAKAEWQELRRDGKQTSQVWNDMLNLAKSQGKAKNPEGMERKWMFTMPFCKEYGFNCPEFQDKK